MECSIAIQILPIDQSSDKDLCRVVDCVIDYINKSGLDYFVGPFETAIQGTYDECMDVLKGCQLVCAKAGCNSMLCYAKIDYRPGGKIMTTEDKVGKYHEGDSALEDAKKFEVA